MPSPRGPSFADAKLAALPSSSRRDPTLPTRRTSLKAFSPAFCSRGTLHPHECELPCALAARRPCTFVRSRRATLGPRADRSVVRSSHRRADAPDPAEHLIEPEELRVDHRL